MDARTRNDDDNNSTVAAARPITIHEILPPELLIRIVNYLDESSKLQLSEVNKLMYEDIITSSVFDVERCVHCHAQFTMLANRKKCYHEGEGPCIPIQNKSHRKHKSIRKANKFELC